MTTYTASLDLRATFAAPQTCAACSAAALRPVRRDTELVFHCDSCGQSWRVDLGRAVQVLEDERTQCG
jgi:ribosomal protein L37AE/L43A